MRRPVHGHFGHPVDVFHFCIMHLGQCQHGVPARRRLSFLHHARRALREHRTASHRLTRVQRDDVRILHRDERLVVVDKPAGLIVHRGWANDDEDLMRTVRDAVGQHVYPVHRLDRGASGVVVMALDSPTAAILGAAFAERRVEKRYWALTRGHPPEEGVIDHPLEKEPGGPRRPATTAYRRLGVSGRYALVEAVPHTGRLHQIRRHLKHVSCPLIGDVRYGKGEHNRLFRERFELHRLALHAAFIAFEHPHEQPRVAIHAELSGSLRSCLEELGLLGAAEEAASTYE
jgi:tRNA pseudouridine65 synthase